MECLDEAVMAGLDFHVATENDPVYGDMLQGGMRSPEMIYTEALGPELTEITGFRERGRSFLIVWILPTCITVRRSP